MVEAVMTFIIKLSSTCVVEQGGSLPTALHLGIQPKLRMRCSGSEAVSYFKAHRLCASLNSRLERNKEKEKEVLGVGVTYHVDAALVVAPRQEGGVQLEGERAQRHRPIPERESVCERERERETETERE